MSIGDYVVSGGELPALVLIDALARLLPGALGDERSSVQESFGDGLLDWPHYTRPEVFAGPARCRRCSVRAIMPRSSAGGAGRASGRTWLRRPELLGRAPLDAERAALLEEFLQRAARQRER